MELKVDFALLKQLRSETAASLQLCQKSLLDHKNDYEKAKASIEIALRDSSKIRARSSDGVSAIGFKRINGSLIIVELSSETDFVLKNDLFYELISDILDVVSEFKNTDILVEDVKNFKKQNGLISVEDSLIEASNIIGEKISICQAKVIRYDPNIETLGVYLHGAIRENMGNLLSVVKLNCQEVGESLELAKNCAMHVAAMKPLSIDRDRLDQKFIDAKMSELEEGFKNQNKPPKVMENIINGAMNKFYSSVCLIDQEYIKDPSITIGSLIKAYGDGNVKVEDFFYISGIS